LIILGIVVLWAAVDARPVIAMAIFIASKYLVVSALDYLRLGAGPLASWQW
jgi:hypothetical protein